MSFPKHTLIQFGGKLAQLSGASEIWTCGIRAYVGDPLGDYIRSPQAYADALAPKLKTWFTTQGKGLAKSATLEFVKVNNIDGAGKYVDPQTHQTAITGAAGFDNASGAPSFCSIATTFETGLARGPAHRGRIYLPNYTIPAAGSQIDAGSVAQIVASGKALLDIINSTPDGGALVKPCVVSALGAGHLHEITGVSVDNVYDVQRRRKNRLVATRTTAAWP